jgi:phosphoglycolate phosphatase
MTLLRSGPVGFDLDMTLVDTASAMRCAWERVNRRLDLSIDVEVATRAMGTPIRPVVAPWVPPDRMDEAMAALSEAFLTVGLPRVRPMPGAMALIRKLRADGVPVVVATTRRLRHAKACLHRCGFVVDEVLGGLTGDAGGSGTSGSGAGGSGAGKADAIVAHRMVSYTGDHPLDMAAAVRAGVPAIGVTTGFHDRHALIRAGAGVVLDGLEHAMAHVLPSAVR